jgi:hypothetical protein
MAAAAISTFPLAHPNILCPPPLRFQKKPRKTTIRRHILRRATHTQKQTLHGPLDDIIAEIQSDIRESAPEYFASPLFLDWGYPLKASPTWAMTPMPVSPAPSDQPLTIRKNRNSRSSASGSSMGDSTSYSRNNSQDESVSGSTVGTTPSLGTSWSSLDCSTSHIAADVSNHTRITIYTEHANAQQICDNAVERVGSTDGIMPQRRPSRLRMLTNGFPRLRRMRTGDASTSAGDASESTPPTTVTTTTLPAGSENNHELNDEAVDTYIERNMRKWDTV